MLGRFLVSLEMTMWLWGVPVFQVFRSEQWNSLHYLEQHYHNAAQSKPNPLRHFDHREKSPENMHAA